MCLTGHLHLKIKNYFLITKLFQPLHMKVWLKGLSTLMAMNTSDTKEAELHPSRPASAEKSQLPVEKQSANEIEKTEVVQERPAVTPEPVVEKSVVENPVACC